MAEKEKTMQRIIVDDIREKEDLSVYQLASMIGISGPSLISRLDGDCGISKFYEILKALGYDMVIMKAPENRTPLVYIGEQACDSCKHKRISDKAKDLLMELQSL